MHRDSVIFFYDTKPHNVWFKAFGQLHEDRDKVKINQYFYFHCKLITNTLTQVYTNLHKLQSYLKRVGKTIFFLPENLFS